MTLYHKNFIHVKRSRNKIVNIIDESIHSFTLAVIMKKNEILLRYLRISVAPKHKKMVFRGRGEKASKFCLKIDFSINL